MNENDANQNGRPIRSVPPITLVSAAEGIKALIIDYHANRHHRLAGGIEQTEVPILTIDLLARLEQVGQRLNTSVASMYRLPDALGTYARRAKNRNRGQPFTDEQHLQITREITGWLVDVLMVRHQQNSALLNGGSLLDVAVEVTGDLLVDGRTVHRMVMNVGSLAAASWDYAVYGHAHHHDTIVWDTYD